MFPNSYLTLPQGSLHPTRPKTLEASGFWGGDEVRATLQTSGYRFQDDAWNAMKIRLSKVKGDAL